MDTIISFLRAQCSKKKSSQLYFLSFILFIQFNANAQLNINPNVTPDQMADTISGSGVAVQNVQMRCANGAYGVFDATNSNVGLQQGILLTTGFAESKPACTYSLTVGDTGNDGWDCNELYIYVDGVQLGPYTDTTTWGSTSYQIIVETGVPIAVEYVNSGAVGCDSSEHWYELYDGSWTVASAGGNNPFGSNLGQIPSGVVSLGNSVCGGTIMYGAEGPNDNNTASVTWYTVDNDPDLMQLEPTATNDVCMLEFDLIPGCDTLEINYVFASEEYLNYVCSSLNDAFGFFISGPGISGSFSNNGINIATVPGTGDYVGINTINNGGPTMGSPCTTILGENCPCNSAYYIDNGEGDNCPGPGHCTNSTIMRYDGRTRPMQAKVGVLPCETYHLKLIIADAGDWSLDSGVFLSMDGLNCSTPSGTMNINTQDTIIEGCLPGEIEIVSNQAVTDTTQISFQILGGTAIDQIDYTGIPSSTSILPGNTSASVLVNGIDDGITEGDETIQVGITYNVCDIVPIQEVIDMVIVPCLWLPIELTRFVAHCPENEYNFPILEWETASEINNAYFTIERSIDEQEFRSVGTIKGKGTSTSNQATSYSWVDSSYILGTAYYRLSQTDLDGQTIILETVAIDCTSEGVKFLPVPFENEITVISQTSGVLTLFDIAGNIIIMQDISAGTTTINTVNLSNGTYIAKYRSHNPNKQERIEKLIKH